MTYTRDELAYLPGSSGAVLTKEQKHEWSVVGKQGELRWLSKHTLNIDPRYQREAVEDKVRRIAAEFDWSKFGVACVARRPDGTLWVFDAQHRVLAAKKRASVDLIPCIVFSFEDVKEEALGFLGTNGERKPVSAFAKYRARLMAGDADACMVEDLFRRHNIVPTPKPTRPLETQVLKWFQHHAKRDPQSLEAVTACAVDLCRGKSILTEVLLEGLMYVHTKLSPLTDSRVRARVSVVGAEELCNSARRAAMAYAKGGAKVWGDAMFAALNKGLHNKIAPCIPEAL